MIDLGAWKREVPKQKARVKCDDDLWMFIDAIPDLIAEIERLRRALQLDEQRLMDAAARAHILYVGCDTPDEMADMIKELEVLISDLTENLGKQEEISDQFRVALVQERAYHMNFETGMPFFGQWYVVDKEAATKAARESLAISIPNLGPWEGEEDDGK